MTIEVQVTIGAAGGKSACVQVIDINKEVSLSSKVADEGETVTLHISKDTAVVVSEA